MNEIMRFDSANNKVALADPASVAAAEAAKQRLQCACIMAMHNPRDTDQARAEILKACKRTNFAKKALYKKPVGGRNYVEGPSARLAETVLRCWKNIFTESNIVYEDEFIRRVHVIVTDVEGNTGHSVQYNINKTVERHNKEGREVVGTRLNTNGETVYIVKCTESELANKEAAMVSKGKRNEGLRLVDEDIIDEAVKQVRMTLSAGVDVDPDADKKRILDAFASIRVTPTDIRNYLGHDADKITPHEIEDLRLIYTTIKDGESTWQDYIDAKNGDKEDTEPPNDKPDSGLKRKTPKPKPPQSTPVDVSEFTYAGDDEAKAGRVFQALCRQIGTDACNAYIDAEFNDSQGGMTAVTLPISTAINILIDPSSFAKNVRKFQEATS